MHHGYYLIPLGSPEKMVTPDFADDQVRSQFDAQNTEDILAGHVGKRLICECLGVEWSVYSDQRFTIQTAKLDWK